MQRRLDDHDDAIAELRSVQQGHGVDILILKTTARVVWVALPTVFGLIALIVSLFSRGG